MMLERCEKCFYFMKGRKKSTISICTKDSTSIELVQIETDVFQMQSFALKRNLQILPFQIQRTPNELIKINLHQI